MKLGWDKVHMTSHMCLGFSAIFSQESVYSRAKYVIEGPFLFSERKTTATNRIYNNVLKAQGKNWCYIWFYSEV